MAFSAGQPATSGEPSRAAWSVLVTASTHASAASRQLAGTARDHAHRGHPYPRPRARLRRGLHRETEDAMLDPITLLALRNKILTIEADRHGLGWTILPASMHVIGVDGRSLRHQALPRPHRLIPTDPPHIQVAAYATAAGPTDPFSAVGVPVAACVIAELCPGYLSSRPPRRIRRLWHARWHQPAVRALIAVDVAEARYYLQRDRDIVPPHQYATPGRRRRRYRGLALPGNGRAACHLAAHEHRAQHGARPRRTKRAVAMPNAGMHW